MGETTQRPDAPLREQALDEGADLQVLRVRGRVHQADGLALRELDEASHEQVGHVRRVDGAREPGGAGQTGEAERFVVAAGAVRVDLARVPLAVLAEEEIDAGEDRAIGRFVGRGGQVLHALRHAVEGALGRVVVRARGDQTDDARRLLGRADRALVHRAREHQRVEVHAARARDVRVPHQVTLAELAPEERIRQGVARTQQPYVNLRAHRCTSRLTVEQERRQRAQAGKARDPARWWVGMSRRERRSATYHRESRLDRPHSRA